jgi:hypothetical protein
MGTIARLIYFLPPEAKPERLTGCSADGHHLEQVLESEEVSRRVRRPIETQWEKTGRAMAVNPGQTEPARRILHNDSAIP